MKNKFTGLKTLEDGTKKWYLNGKLHREDGPAIEFVNGDKFWYKNGKRHREDGPAVEDSDGDNAWYFNGILCWDQGEWLWKILQKNSTKLNKLLIKLEAEISIDSKSEGCVVDKNDLKQLINFIKIGKK